MIFGINVVDLVIAGGIGALFVAFLDKVYKMLLMNFFPDKFLLKLVKDIDDKYIDEFKKKYPTAGGEAEKKIARTLSRMADIILDKGE